MACLTGKTIGQLTLLPAITDDTLFAVELSGITYHIPYSAISSNSAITSNNYGSFSDDRTQPVSGSNIATVWKYNTTEISNGIYIQDDTKITVSNTGIYEIGYSAQIAKTQGGTPDVITIWAAINGTPVPRSSSTTSVESNNSYSLPFVSYIFELNAGDYVEFYFSSPSQYVEIQAISGFTSPTRPDNPSIIIVAKEIGSAVVGTSGDSFVTGFTLVNSDLILTQNRIGMYSGFSVNLPFLPLTGGTIYGDLLVTGSTSATTYYGDGSKLTGISRGGGSAGGQIYYFNISNTQTPYYEFSKTATTAPEQTISQSVAGLSTSLIGGFMTPVGDPNLTSLNAGIISFYLHGYDGTNHNFNFFCELFSRTTGGTETLLFTSEGAPVIGATPVMVISDGYFSGATLNSSDRLVVKVFAQNITNQTRTINFVSEGGPHYSFAITTIPTAIDTYVTGFTYSANTLTISQNNDQPDLSVVIDTMTGLTIDGNLIVSGDTILNNLTATTISVTGLTAETIYTSGLTADTISATTYLGIPYYSAVTKSQLDSLILNNELVIGLTYNVIDADINLYGGTSIFVKAISNNKISLEGDGIFYTPKYNQNYNGFGIWTNQITQTSVLQNPNKLVEIDSNINNNFFLGIGFNNAVYAIAQLSDGSLLAGGAFSSYKGITCNCFVKLNKFGYIDPTFNIGTGFNNVVYSISIQSDGKILVGGLFAGYDGNTCYNLARLNQDGTFDTTFDTSTNLNGGVYSVAIDSNDKIVIGGTFTQYSGNSCTNLARINPDASFDSTFNTSTNLNGVVYSVTIDSNDKILAGGLFTNYSGNTCQYLARINSDASFDTTFNTSSNLNGVVYSIAIDSNDKVLIGGGFTDYSGNTSNFLARLNPDASWDNTFNTFTNLNSSVNSIVIDSNNKIVIGGQFAGYSGNPCQSIARINPDASFDTTFNIGIGFAGSVYSLVLQSDGDILCGGSFTSFNNISSNFIAIIHPNGFFVGSGFNNFIRTSAIQVDGKILLGGDFNSYNGISCNGIIRLNVDGTIDNTFNIGIGFNNSVFSIKIDSNNKIIIGGNFQSYNGNIAYYLIRLNQDGTIDNTFNTGTNLNSGVFVVKIDSNGKILVGGTFTNYSTNTSFYLVRLNTDGSYDNTFNTSNNLDGGVVSIDIDSNNKILIGGGFTNYSGNTCYYLARLNQDASFDTTFNTSNNLNNQVISIKVDTNDKVLIGGFFNSYSGNQCTGLARINPDASFDNTFNTGTNLNGFVYDISFDINNKILIVGSFTDYSGITAYRIARLNNDSTFDTTFNTGIRTGFAFDGNVYTMSIQNDNKLIVAGNFNNYDGISSNRVARLDPNVSLSFGPKNVVQSSTTGVGTGYTPNLTITSGITTINSIVNYGSKYEINDEITFLGSELGGIDGIHNLILKVDFAIPANIGDTIIWGGYVWENLNGNLGSPLDVFNLDSEWSATPYNTSGYNMSIDFINYDYENDSIILRKDKLNNNVSTTYENIQYFKTELGVNYNPLKVFQWGNGYILSADTGVSENHIYDSLFECINFKGRKVLSNKLFGRSYIQNNTFENNSSILHNILDRSIIENNVLNQNSVIENNILNNTTFDFSSSGTLNNKNITQIDAKNSNVNVNISGATDIYGNFGKSIFKNDVGNPLMSYFSGDTLILVDVNN